MPPRPGPPPDWGHIQGLFLDALDMPAAAREAFLQRVDADDPGLATEVRSLLRAHAASSGFLTTPPGLAPGSTIFAGDMLGPWRIVEEIGRGGMGVVYRATREDEHFRKDVAIKLIDPGMRSDAILRRFRAERRILAMLDHPHIARMIDGGTAPDGAPYLVMDYVQGQPLLAWCDAHRLGVDERLTLFIAVCEAVQFAHQRLVVHRDLKSDNILVTSDGSPRLLDFGIAKLLTPDTGGAPATVTAPMQRMLTPDYASPEQIRGEPATVAGDVYSLGVVLYELLSGTRPLRFPTRSPEEILRVVTHEEPPPPSARVARSADEEAARRRGDTTRRLRRRLAGDLDDVVMKALEKDPARRYGSAEQLAQDLRRHLEGLPVLARGRSTAYLLSRFVRRHRAAVVAASLVALSLIGGLVATTWEARVARRERDLATQRFQDVRELSHAVIFDIHDAIANLPGSTRAREILVQHALRYLDRLGREAGGDQSLQHELALAYAKIGDVQGRPMFPNLGRTSAALRSYDTALTLLEGVSRAEPESTSVVHDIVVVSQRRVDLLAVMGRHKEAMDESQAMRGRIHAELARRPNDLVFLSDLCILCNRLVDMRLNAADTLGALEESRMNVSLAEMFYRIRPQVPESRRGAMIACAKMANLCGLRGERDSAGTYYERAERLAHEAVRALPDNTDARRDQSVLYGMHALFLADFDVDSALAVYGRCQDIAEDMAAHDPDNALMQADVAAGHHDIGSILMKGHRYREAEVRFGEAFRRFGQLVAMDSTNAENRTFMARSGREAGEACQALANGAHSPAERAHWRGRALDWLERSRAIYEALARAGALTGEDVAAPQQIAHLVAGIRSGS